MTLRFLPDSNIWIDHLRRADATLQAALVAEEIVGHPFVIGEIAMGSVSDREEVLHLLSSLPQADRAEDDEVLDLVEGRRLFNLGLGWVDAHLLASTLLTPETKLWTRDLRLREAAERLGIAGAPARQS